MKMRFEKVEGAKTDVVKEIEADIKDGYIAKDGRPLKCKHCKSRDFFTHHGYEETMIVEKIVQCNGCGKQVGYWSYGAWDF